LVGKYGNELITSELGMRPDGQVLIGKGSEERRGLGSESSDVKFPFFPKIILKVYSQFRKQRSHQYQVSVEERSQGREHQDVCFVCRQPGHLARDCKFGLT
jgi:hypothetical protein